MDGMHPLLRSGLGLFREATVPVAESMWWDPSGGLYWCNSEAGTLSFSALGAPVSGVDDKVMKLPPLLAAFAPAPDGFVIAGKNAVALVNPLGAFLRTLARPAQDGPHSVPRGEVRPVRPLHPRHRGSRWFLEWSHLFGGSAGGVAFDLRPCGPRDGHAVVG